MEADPQFPNRPTHPDFDKLSAIAIENDARTDEVQSEDEFEEFVGEYVDIDSLQYVAMNRAGMLVQQKSEDTGLSPDKQAQVNMARLAAAGAGIIDGFMLGVKFAQAGGHVDA